VRDLDLLIQPALRLLRAAVPGDRQLAAVDLDRAAVDLDSGQVDGHDRGRRLPRVIDVDARAEAPRRGQPAALEDVAEQLVDLAPHAFEVGEQITFPSHVLEATDGDAA
jgi:hypothetical protein